MFYFQLPEAHITVHTIAISNNADVNTDKLAKETNGQSFYIPDPYGADIVTDKAEHAFKEITDNVVGKSLIQTSLFISVFSSLKPSSTVRP